MNSSDKESNSEAESSHDINDSIKSLSDAYVIMYSKWIKMNEKSKKIKTQVWELFFWKVKVWKWCN